MHGQTKVEQGRNVSFLFKWYDCGLGLSRFLFFVFDDDVASDLHSYKRCYNSLCWFLWLCLWSFFCKLKWFLFIDFFYLLLAVCVCVCVCV